MKNVFDIFCSEIWCHTASFFPSLSSFVFFWFSVPELVRSEHTHNAVFWTSLLKYLCLDRNRNYNEFSKRLGINDTGIFMVRQLFRQKLCSRSGCYCRYTEWCNAPTACSYHPGKLRPNGLLSCCRGKGFRSAGCKTAFHDGVFFNLVHMARRKDESSENNNMSSGDSSNSNAENSLVRNPGNGRLPSIYSNRTAACPSAALLYTDMEIQSSSLQSQIADAATATQRDGQHRLQNFTLPKII